MTKKETIIVTVGCFLTLLFLLVISTTCQPTPPKPKLTIEEIREQRQIKYHEAGKDVNQFIKGTIGK